MAEPNPKETVKENGEKDCVEVKITSQECLENKDDIKDMIDDKSAVEVETIENHEESDEVEGEYFVKPEDGVKSVDAKNISGKEVEEEDDVPANFFDDLMNEDFIDGLNVVDAWDESDTQKNASKDKRSPIRYPSKSPNEAFKPVKTPSHTRHYRERDLRLSSPKRHKRKSASPLRSVSDHKQKHKSKIKKPRQNSSEADVRRDPSKTKRDIQRHKDKCAKDEEARIISEKLKVCETGLVPPGTEMDIDLEKFSAKKDETPEKPVDDFTAKYANRRSHSLERILERRKLETIRDLERLSMERRSLERRLKIRRSLERRSMERRRNYLKNRSRTRSPPRRRSPIYNRKIEERKSAERRIRGRYRSRSRSRNDIVPSPKSDVSERESWLKSKSRGKSRSPASLSKRSRSFLKELDRLSKPRPKKSFLKELEEKLYPLDIPGANVISHQTMPLQPMMHVMPSVPQMSNFPVAPVPPPMPVPHPTFTPMQQEYDQQFFIGPQPDMQFNVHGCPPGPGPYQQGSFMPQDPAYGFPPPHPSAFPLPHSQVNPVPLNAPMQMSPNIISNTPVHQQAVAEKQGGQNLDAYKKLLEEKKISLSDFLSLTANFSDNTKPIDIKNKIKVITRCQEAVKELSEDAKMGGSFVLRKIRKSSEKIPDVTSKSLSPYRKIAAVRFNFTTHLKQQNEEKSGVSSALNRLLLKIGNEPVFNTPKESPVSSEEKVTVVQRAVKPVIMEKFIQTEELRCKECEARKSIKTYSVGSQTTSVLTFDISCQVSDETFQKPLKSILKNQSLAHLTPAQLLAAQSAEDDSPPRDLFPSARKILLETPSDPKPSRLGGITVNSSQGGPFRADRIAPYDLNTNRFNVANPNPFEPDRHERFVPEPFHKPVISPNRPNFERQVRPSPRGRGGQFSTFSNRPLNFEPPPFPNYLQKPRNMEQSSENSRPFFEPPHQGSGGFQQGGKRF